MATKNVRDYETSNTLTDVWNGAFEAAFNALSDGDTLLTIE